MIGSVKMNDAKNTEIFRRKFLELEKLTINEEDNDEKLASKIKDLKNKHREPFYSKYDFIDFCRECRNRISHNGYENDFIFYGDKMLEKFDEIIEEIKHPYKVYDKATKSLHVTLEDRNGGSTYDGVLTVFVPANSGEETEFQILPNYYSNRFPQAFMSEVLPAISVSNKSSNVPMEVSTP